MRDFYRQAVLHHIAEGGMVIQDGNLYWVGWESKKLIPVTARSLSAYRELVSEGLVVPPTPTEPAKLTRDLFSPTEVNLPEEGGE